MHKLSIDLETYSSVPIAVAGAFRYIDSPDFEILLFAYSLDRGPVHVIDLATGESVPEWLVSALHDPEYIKYAYNAAFEWGCLSKVYGPMIPEQWRDTMLYGRPRRDRTRPGAARGQAKAEHRQSSDPLFLRALQGYEDQWRPNEKPAAA